MYAEFDCIRANLLTEIADRVAAVTGWTAAAPTGLPTPTTTTGALGTSSVAVTAGSTNGFAVGDWVTIARGTPRMTNRKLATVTATLMTWGGVSVAAPAPVSGDTVEVVERIVRHTPAPAGSAELILELSEQHDNNLFLAVTAFRTRDNAHTAAGAPGGLLRAVWMRASGTALGDHLCHVVLGVSDGCFYLSVEGPRQGETGPQGVDGSQRGAFLANTLEPYFPGAAPADPTKAYVVLGGTTGSTTIGDRFALVSRNAADTASWVQAYALTLTTPDSGSTILASGPPLAAQLDGGRDYLFPYVIVEQVAGMRGRLRDAVFCGYNNPAITGDTSVMAGERFTLGGREHVAVAPFRLGTYGAMGAVPNTSAGAVNNSPILAIPT